MSRTLAIALTIIAVLLCGLPWLGLICFGTLGAVGGTSPDVMSGFQGTAEDLKVGVILFVCGGLLLLFIPLAVGLLSFRLSRQAEPSSPDHWD